MNILCTNHNTRDEYTFLVQQKIKRTRPMALMHMLKHDCQHADIEMNRAYAMDLRGLY